jgi:hypothetical protein
MIGTIIWFVLCLIMGVQANNVGLALGFWGFTMVFIALSTGSSQSTRNQFRRQNEYDNAYRNYVKESKESKKGTIEFEEKIKR